MTVVEARWYQNEGHFAPGSMKPKIEACIRFLEQHSRADARCIITNPENLEHAVYGHTGTHIVRLGVAPPDRSIGFTGNISLTKRKHPINAHRTCCRQGSWARQAYMRSVAICTGMVYNKNRLTVVLPGYERRECPREIWHP